MNIIFWATAALLGLMALGRPHHITHYSDVGNPNQIATPVATPTP